MCKVSMSGAHKSSMTIPGWIYIILGIAFIAYSKFIQSKAAAGKSLMIFFIIGGAFIVWGVLREIVPRLRSRPNKKELVGPPHTPAQHQSTQLHPAGQQQHGVSSHASHQHVQPQQYPSHPYQPIHKACPRCHQNTSGSAKFCHSCGFQFF